MMTKLLAVVAMGFGATVVPAHAFAAGTPQALSDAQLDEVVGAGGPPAFVIAAGHGPPWMHQAPTTVNIGSLAGKEGL